MLRGDNKTLNLTKFGRERSQRRFQNNGKILTANPEVAGKAQQSLYLTPDHAPIYCVWEGHCGGSANDSMTGIVIAGTVD